MSLAMEINECVYATLATVIRSGSAGSNSASGALLVDIFIAMDRGRIRVIEMNVKMQYIC